MTAHLEEERKQYEEQLEIVVASLKDDPNNAELLALKDELDQMIKLIDDSLAELKPKREAAKPPVKVPSAAVQAPTPPPPPSSSREQQQQRPQEWTSSSSSSRERSRVASQPPEDRDAPEASYQVNDNVMARWVSGDKGFYPARITAVTGSSTNPIYTVKFKSYDTIETLRAKDIRPMAQKRKAGADDAAPPAAAAAAAGVVAAAPPTSRSPTARLSLSPGPQAPASSVVLSADPALYPQAAAAAQKEGADPEKPVKKFKKIKATKELEAGKSKWQEFTAKSKFGKAHKKESMFRTPEGVHGRVGFTGSGQAMRKDPTRSRHIYQPNEDLD